MFESFWDRKIQSWDFARNPRSLLASRSIKSINNHLVNAYEIELKLNKFIDLIGIKHTARLKSLHRQRRIHT